MATRVRFLLYQNDKNYPVAGPAAIYTVVAEAARYNRMGMDYPDDWKKRTLTKKLEYLMQYVPPEWVLRIFHEPKNTRSFRSIYRYNRFRRLSDEVQKKPKVKEDWVMMQEYQRIMNEIQERGL